MKRIVVALALICCGSIHAQSNMIPIPACSAAPVTEGALCDNTTAGQLQSFVNGVLGVENRTLFASNSTATLANST
jgi:hypothetical protein